MTTVRENRLFLGNPGAGKSTLLNCLLGDSHFRSGLCFSFQPELQRFEKDGVAYMDTPGFADEMIEALTTALQQGGTYKLFFLLRILNGRVVGEDLVALERVLDSIDAGDLNYKFTIVMNCLGEREYQSLMARGKKFNTIKSLINRKYVTESFCFVPRIRALEDEEIVQLPRDVREFLDKQAPVITVKSIRVDKFAMYAEEIKSELEQLRLKYLPTADKDEGKRCLQQVNEWLRRSQRCSEQRHDHLNFLSFGS